MRLAVTMTTNSQIRLRGKLDNRRLLRDLRRASITQSSLGLYDSSKWRTLSPAGPVLLDRRTLDRAIRAENTAVAGSRAQKRLTLLALIEKLTGIFWHGFALRVSAVRTGQDRFEFHRIHCDGSSPTVDGKPTLEVASVRASAVVLASSKTTVACLSLKLTFTDSTPSTRDKDFLTVIGQVTQVMPETSNVTVRGAA